MTKLVWGVGINDEGNQQVLERTGGKVKRLFTDPIYIRWSGMLQRSYSAAWKEKHPSYGECSVCEEWLTYSNFKKWILEKSGSFPIFNYDLDKDLLIPESSMYSKETCALIPRYLNRSIVRRDLSDTTLTGVRKRNGKFASQIFADSKKLWLGTFDTEIEAHNCWKAAKIKELERLLSKYREDDLYFTEVDEAIQRCIEKLKMGTPVGWIL